MWLEAREFYGIGPDNFLNNFLREFFGRFTAVGPSSAHLSNYVVTHFPLVFLKIHSQKNPENDN